MLPLLDSTGPVRFIREFINLMKEKRDEMENENDSVFRDHKNDEYGPPSGYGTFIFNVRRASWWCKSTTGLSEDGPLS